MLIQILTLISCLFLRCFVEARPHSYADEPPPKLTLPWGTWEGKLYGENQDYYLFSNVRFGKAPIGDLRFAAPQYPDAIKDPKQVQDSSFGPGCIQAKVNATFDPTPFPNGTESEDCLFLDIYVPVWFPELDEPELPVVVWLYGGAYVFGSKNTTASFESGPFSAYDGAGIRDASRDNLVWVTANYRMGAYGFLAGKTMEDKKNKAQPNAGLLDQRLVLDWVQKYIHLVKGDNASVSLWGTSAGAGSILHHLTAYGGTLQNNVTLFSKAVLWSTGFQWSYDRQGTLENTFLDFTEKSSCQRDAASALSCLRGLAKDSDKLRQANQAIVSKSVDRGLFPFGPAVDGDLVPDLPAVSLSKGKHIKVDSLILSHDFFESEALPIDWVKKPEDFTEYLNLVFPGKALSSIRESIAKKYPTEDDEEEDVRQKRRLQTVLQDVLFVCNKYQVFKAYEKNKTKVYTTRFDLPPATHGFTLLPLVFRDDIDGDEFLQKLIPGQLPNALVDFYKRFINYLSRSYQAYFAGHAATGDPNYFMSRQSQYWRPDESTDDGLTNTLRVAFTNNQFHPLFTSESDYSLNAESCNFWNDIAAQISGLTRQDTDAQEIHPGLLAQVPELR